VVLEPRLRPKIHNMAKCFHGLFPHSNIWFEKALEEAVAKSISCFYIESGERVSIIGIQSPPFREAGVVLKVGMYLIQVLSFALPY
jgi:hypothetical protein